MLKAMLFVLFPLLSQFGYSQNLRGTWEGSFSYVLGGNTTSIRVHLQYVNKTVLSGYSVTFFSRSEVADTITAKLRGTVKKNRVMLFELPLNEKQLETNPGYQVMEMNYTANKKDTVMKGLWYAGHGAGRTVGHISFAKINDD